MRSPDVRPVKLNWLRQILSFGAVGIVATLAHVAVAWVLIDEVGAYPYLANLVGTCAASVVSFLGNAEFTFTTDRSIWSCARRYLFVSLFSLAMTSSILAIVKHNALPTYVYVLVVLVTVPPMTFLIAKLWAFRRIATHI